VIYPNNISEKRDNLKVKRSNSVNLDVDENEIGLFLVTNKHKVWKYEKEVRLIVDAELKENNKSFNKSYDEKYLYMEFDLKNISKVIFGLNSDKSDEIITINMLREKGLSPKYEKMIINPISLMLESEEYNSYPN
jgi:hypothetical protein